MQVGKLGRDSRRYLSMPPRLFFAHHFIEVAEYIWHLRYIGASFFWQSEHGASWAVLNNTERGKIWQDASLVSALIELLFLRRTAQHFKEHSVKRYNLVIFEEMV